MNGTLFVDIESDRGAWERHLRHTACMRRCARCGVSGWHPEARSCAAQDCELRQHAEAVEFPVHDASVTDKGAQHHVC